MGIGCIFQQRQNLFATIQQSEVGSFQVSFWIACAQVHIVLFHKMSYLRPWGLRDLSFFSNCTWVRRPAVVSWATVKVEPALQMNTTEPDEDA